MNLRKQSPSVKWNEQITFRLKALITEPQNRASWESQSDFMVAEGLLTENCLTLRQRLQNKRNSGSRRQGGGGGEPR